MKRKKDSQQSGASLLSERRTPEETARANREANVKLWGYDPSRPKARSVRSVGKAKSTPVPVVKRNLKIAPKLLQEIVQQLFPKWVKGDAVPVIKPKKVQRIPIGEALLWRVSYGEVIKWDHESLHYEAIRTLPLHSVPMRFCDCLHIYCLSKWGQDRGDDVFQNVVLDVLSRDKRDLRRSEFHRQYDKRKPHRQKKSTGTNRYKKPVFRTQEDYWQWLLKRCTQTHNNWRRHHAANFPARGRKLLEEY
jgi:hypothetical protein